MNVDTDQIIPARFLKFPRQDGYAKFLFHDVAEHPDFVLNRAPFRDAKILVGNRNFGCGSSREGAAYAFFDRGFRSVIAPSFGDIFHNNCLKNGIVPVRLPDQECSELRDLLSKNPGTQLTVDLAAQEVREPGGRVHLFTVDGFYREMLLEGLDELGLTLTLLPQIEAFERNYDVLG
jgi:3-isopropylmalate/(R)-2-methylmalate dehydratase small subunit